MNFATFFNIVLLVFMSQSCTHPLDDIPIYTQHALFSSRALVNVCYSNINKKNQVEDVTCYKIQCQEFPLIVNKQYISN
jgi:hypothetical protein